MAYCLNPQDVVLLLQSGSSVPSTVFTYSSVQPSPTFSISSCAYAVVTGPEAAALQQLSQPYDWVSAAAIWAFAFSTVLALWFLSSGAGSISKAIKGI